MNNFNMIVSTYRNGEEYAEAEIRHLLAIFGDGSVEPEITDISGILLINTKLNAFDVVNKLKELVNAEPWQIRHIMRVLPVEKTCPTHIDDIKAVVRELSIKLRPTDTFRITLEKRYTSLNSIDVIKVAAGEVQDNSVDLDDPDWIILIQILGKRTGISVLKPDFIFSSVLEKRRMNNQER